MLGLWIITVLFSSSMETTAPSLTVGNAIDAKPDEIVEIPIYYEGDHSTALLQFDVFFDTEQISEVDFGDCVIDIANSQKWSACNRLPPPNEDVIRFIVFGIPLGVIPSGRLGVLKFKISNQAVKDKSVLHIDECSSLRDDANANSSRFLAAQLHDGFISIDSSIENDPVSEPELKLASGYIADFSDMPALAKSRYRVDYSEDVQAGANELLIDVPGTEAFRVTMKEFKPRKGYVPRVGCGNQMLPDPNASASEMSYRWYGENQFGHPTAITVTNGYLHGFMSNTGHSFEISGDPDDGYQIIEIDNDKLPPVH